MNAFWQTLPTIKAAKGTNYHAFSLFGPLHLSELAVSLLLTVICAYFYKQADEKGRKKILWVVTILMLVDEVAKYVVTISTGQWSWIYLPLHICSINIFVCLYHTITGSEKAKEIIYALALPGALLALLSPSWQAAPLWNFMHLHSLSIHFLLALYPILLLVGGFRPKFHNALWVLCFLVGAAIPIYFLNHALDTNFFFLNGTGGVGLTTVFASIFGEQLYFLAYPILIAAVGVILYLPWKLVEFVEAHFLQKA